MKNWREQFGRMLIETFVCGVPVIGSDSREIPFVIGDAGNVVPEAWAQAIARLLDSPKDRDELRTRGLARAPKFSVTTIAQQYRDYYGWLAANRFGNRR